MLKGLKTNHPQIFADLRNGFACSKLSTHVVPWGKSQRRRQFYDECDRYEEKFGRTPPKELFESLWDHSVDWVEGEDFGKEL